ncbi:hypothetical protein [Escherichia coli]|uniref:hypothetical protein n=1 Tax=Escherichia coli TaxID=562 RepID=UPI002665A283|nr:hypothetical protein [Escherichia coli]MDO2848746.1 hypothetical protein [Escherichia coli]
MKAEGIHHEYLRSHLVVVGRRHYLFLVEECCIGDGMDIFELLAIMCGMMLGTVAIIIIIGLVVGSIK